MKKYINTFFITLLISLNACGSFQDTMTGQRKKTTDEFLVKKKDPLILPPEFEELPIPNTKKEQKQSNSIESVFKKSGESVSSSKNISNLEKMILKELEKNN